MGVVAALQIDHEFPAIPSAQRTVDEAFDVVKIKPSQTSDKIQRNIRMAKGHASLAKKWIRNPTGQGMRAAMQIEVEQREFRIHRGCLARNTQITLDLQRYSGGCNDVEHLLGKIVATQIVLNGTGDLIVK